MPRAAAPSAAQVAEIKKLAKNIVNPRLTRIEKYARQPEYKALTKFAYKKFVAEAKHLGMINMSKTGMPRVSLKAPTTAAQAEKWIAAMRGFQQMESSTLKSYKKLTMKRYNTFNDTMRRTYLAQGEKWTDLTIEEYSQFWNQMSEGGFDRARYSEELRTIQAAKTASKTKDEELKEAFEDLAKKRNMQSKAKKQATDKLKDLLIKKGMLSVDLDDVDDLYKIAKFAAKYIL